MGGLWLHPVSFFLTGLIILAGMQYEYYQMIRNTGVKPQMVPGMIAGATAYILSTCIAAGYLKMEYLLLIVPMIIVIMINELYRKQEKPFDSISHTIFCVAYTAIPLSMFPFAAFSREGLESLIPAGGISFSPGILIGFFILIWINDTGAYLAGSVFGKHRLMERISPKKSWEGFIAGALLALIVAWLLSGWLGITDRWGWMIISIIISISGTFGDLIESMLKRSIGIKDSGKIMPGHGGFLDRFDSTLIAFPLVFLFITLFG